MTGGEVGEGGVGVVWGSNTNTFAGRSNSAKVTFAAWLLASMAVGAGFAFLRAETTPHPAFDRARTEAI